MASTTTHLPTFISEPFEDLSLYLSFPSDQLKLVTCFLLSIPLGFIHAHISSTRIKHIYSIAVGLLYTYFVTGIGSFHLLLSSTIVYIFTLYYPSRPSYVFTFSMLYLSISHIYRLYVDYLGWSLDFTMIQMVYAVKSITYAYNVYDGYMLEKHKEKPLHPKHSIHEFRVQHCIRQQPSPLEYYSYVYFFPGVLVGPCFEYRDYIDFTNRSVFENDGYHGYIPSTVIPTFICLGRAMLCYIGVIVGGMMPVMGYVNTPEFYDKKNLSFLYKFTYIFIATSAVRFKYYFAWILSESGCVAAGLGYNGTYINQQTGEKYIKWNCVTNVNVMDVELATNFSVVTNNWNMGVNNWLKNYVYFRVHPPRYITRILPQKSVANIVTKLASAFWHGFYSAYYLFFISAWLINEADAVMQTVISRYFLTVTADKIRIYRSPLHRIVWVSIAWLFTMSSLNYMACAFVLLRGRWAINAWNSVYWVMHVVAITLIIAGRVITIAHPLKRSVKKVEHTSAIPAEMVNASKVDAGRNGIKSLSNDGEGIEIAEKVTRSGVKYGNEPEMTNRT